MSSSFLALQIIVPLFLTLPLRAQTPDLNGKTVNQIVYVPVEQPIAVEDLKLVQQLSVGAAYSGKDVAATIDRMFATGAYSDIQVDVEQQSSGLVVRFLTKAAAIVGHVEIKGKISDPPNRSVLTAATQLRLGAPFTQDDIATAEKNINQLLISNGLYESEAHIDTEQGADTELVHITAHVRAGKRARYEMPNITGETKLSNSTIIRATGWRIILIHRWRQVTQALTDQGVEGVHKKYQKDDRLAASVELKGLDYDRETRRVKPNLDINAGPKIKVKAVEAKIRKGRLKKYVPVYEVGATDDDLLFEGARNLTDYFQSNGYPDVEVTFRRGEIVNDEQTIEYVIAKGPKKKLARVDFKGNRFFKDDALRERIFLLAASFRFRHGRYSESFRKRDEESISELYRSNGFRDVKVSSAVMENYNGKAGQIAVTYLIEEGPQWLVAKLDLEDFDAGNGTALRARFSSAQGQPFSDVSVATDRNLALTYYYAQGYPNAAFEWSTMPAAESHQVNLTYKITPGLQEFVRGVIVLGLTRTHPGLVQKHLGVHEGDPLSLTHIDQERRALDELGIFAKVDSAIENSDGLLTRKNVLYDIQEANRYTVRLGVGAEIAQIGGTTSNLSQPVGGTGFSPRFLLNVNRINFLGLGHTISFDGRYSNLEQRAGLNYRIPNFLNSDRRSIIFSILYDKSTDVRTFSAKRAETSAQLSQKFSKPTTVFFRFNYRRVSTSNVVIPDLLVPQLVQPIRIGIFSVNWVQDRRDNPADAHRGMYNSLDVGIATSIFGSQRNFARGLGRNATYHPVRRSFVLARQLTFGLVKPFNLQNGLSPAEAVPLPERLFGGGNISHRGFGENQAGPRDIGQATGPNGIATQPTGFPLGGNALLFHSTELRFPLLGENINGVVFHDMGNIYSDLSSISFRFHQKSEQDFNYMVHAVGFGIRYRTPVGPVRLDLAYSINPPKFFGFQGTVDQLLTCKPNPPPGTVVPPYCQAVSQSLSHFQFFFSIGQTF